MAAVDESNSSLNAQCMEFCQALARQGLAFKCSVTIGSHFTFSLDAKEGKATPATRNKKRSSPSTRRRNAKRREEFLKNKSSSATAVHRWPRRFYPFFFFPSRQLIQIAGLPSLCFLLPCLIFLMNLHCFHAVFLFGAG